MHPEQCLPATYFLVSNGLLYFRIEPCDLLVVPQPKTQFLMHSHPLSSHLGVHNILGKLHDRLLWPIMDADIRALCQQCPQCLCVEPQKPPLMPHIPLPIIGVPFERIGMDLLGPLPKSA